MIKWMMFNKHAASVGWLPCKMGHSHTFNNSLKVDGSAKSCLRDKRVIPLVCISKHRSIHDNQLSIFKENS